jgi:putative PIN family toxin of toxin-antitoxin system
VTTAGKVRALLDASVLINYLLTPVAERAAGSLIRAAIDGAYTLLLMEALAEETRQRVAHKPYLALNIEAGQLDRLWSLLAEVGEMLPRLLGPFPPRGRDPKDDYLLAYALAYRADYVVTWDKDLRDLEEVEGVWIVDPPEFLRILRASGRL